MTIKNPANFLALVCLCFVAATVLSCKKEIESTITQEQLGDLKPLDAYSVWFNFKGDPIIRIEANMFPYEWNPATKTWTKLGTIMLPAARFMQVVQDNRGTYYGRSQYWIFELNKTTNTWDTLDIMENKLPQVGNVNELLANANGDILIQVERNNKHHIFVKRASTDTWVKLKEYENSNADHRPYFFTTTGYVYFTGNTMPSTYPLGILRDKIFNTNTGDFGLLFDKGEPSNYNYSPFGSLGQVYIKPDGTVYFIYQDGATIYEADLMKITAGNYPSMITKMRDLKVPGLHSTGGWSTLTQEIVVDDSENIKTYLACNNGVDPAHMTEALLKKGASEFQTFQHPLSRRLLYSNFDGVAFVLHDKGLLYRWE